MLRGLSEQGRQDFIADKLAARLEAAENDPEFKKQLSHHRAEQDIKEWLEYREPQGEYDPQDVFPLDDEGRTYKCMEKASREDLLVWRAIIGRDPGKGCNLANIQYIDSRLACWSDQKNLAELEKELSDA